MDPIHQYLLLKCNEIDVYIKYYNSFSYKRIKNCRFNGFDILNMFQSLNNNSTSNEKFADKSFSS